MHALCMIVHCYSLSALLGIHWDFRASFDVAFEILIFIFLFYFIVISHLLVRILIELGCSVWVNILDWYCARGCIVIVIRECYFFTCGTRICWYMWWNVWWIRSDIWGDRNHHWVVLIRIISTNCFKLWQHWILIGTIICKVLCLMLIP